MGPLFLSCVDLPAFILRVDEGAILTDSAHSGGTAEAAVVPVPLHLPWFRLNSEALVRWPSKILRGLFWWWFHERLELVSSLARVSPRIDLWSTFSSVGWALVSTFSGFQVDPESISVSAASVKVVGVIRLFTTTLFHRCLPSFPFPRSQHS